MADSPRIKIMKDGPYIVTGGVPLSEDAIVVGDDRHHMEYRRMRDFDVQETYSLCRCGHSSTMPFCDGSHARTHFHGAEVASEESYLDRADVYPGPKLYLFDDNRCAYARFCHRRHGDVWTLTENSELPGIKDEAIEASWDCPTGRLVHVDPRTQEVFEEAFDPSIVILEDVEEESSGPLFVRGGIPLEGSDGVEYEQRNRYALCRCGHSRNMPFCDAMHISFGFNDGSQAFEGRRGTADDSFHDRPGSADQQ